jgi:hypothetical protein
MLDELLVKPQLDRERCEVAALRRIIDIDRKQRGNIDLRGLLRRTRAARD